MNREITNYKRNRNNPETAMERAMKGLPEVEEMEFTKFYNMLSELARTGKPGEFFYKDKHIRYHTKDEHGKHKLFWLVTNGISGRQAYFYNMDYVTPKGRVKWRRMASDMKKV